MLLWLVVSAFFDYDIRLIIFVNYIRYSKEVRRRRVDKKEGHLIGQLAA